MPGDERVSVRGERCFELVSSLRCSTIAKPKLRSGLSLVLLASLLTGCRTRRLAPAAPVMLALAGKGR